MGTEIQNCVICKINVENVSTYMIAQLQNELLLYDLALLRDESTECTLTSSCNSKQWYIETRS